MADGVLNKQVTCVQVGFDNTTTGGAIANLNGVKKVLLQSSVNCFVDFDQPVSTTQSFLLMGTNTSPAEVSGEMGLIDKIYVRGQSGSGTLYIIAIAG